MELFKCLRILVPFVDLLCGSLQTASLSEDFINLFLGLDAKDFLNLVSRVIIKLVQ